MYVSGEPRAMKVCAVVRTKTITTRSGRSSGQDSEATNSPRPEREREQEPVEKAGRSRRHVRCGSATPEHYD